MLTLHRLSRPLLATALLTALAADASSAPLYYGTRASFDAANPGLAIEDFEDLDGTGTTVAFSGPVDSSSTIGGVVSPGQIAAGIAFADDPLGGSAGFDMFLSGPGQSSQPTTALGSNFPGSDSLNLLFAGTATALGLDIFQNAGAGAQSGVDQTYTISLFDALDVLIGSTTVTVPSSSFGFFGVFSDVAFARANVSSDAGHFEVIDDVEFGSGSGVVPAVPEPSTLTLLGLGLAGLGVRFRRRKAAAAA